MTCVTQVSSDNANITADHQEPAEVLSQLGDMHEYSLVYVEFKYYYSGSLWCVGGLWCLMYPPNKITLGER